MTKDSTHARPLRALTWQAAGAAALLALLACDDDEPQVPTAYITVENTSSVYSVRSVYIAPASGTAGWGLDRLTSDIGPGERRTLDFPADTYDVRIESDHPDSPLDLNDHAFAEDAVVTAVVSDASMAWYY